MLPAASPASTALRNEIQRCYDALNYEAKPEFEVFRRAVTGYLNLKNSGKLGDKEMLAIIDFSKSSNEKRLWVIDMKNHEVVYHDLVAHGKNSGNEFARTFSNTPNSNMSSLGFYLTAENYYGKHGLSLRLDGLEKGFNDNARKRAIVMHGAGYVDASYTRNYGRIGRSFGCPAIPLENHEEILTLISEGTCLFIYSEDNQYNTASALLDEESAYDGIAALHG